MNIAGLMPIRCGPITDKHGSIAQLLKLCDHVFILEDNSDPSAIADLKAKYPAVRSWIRIESPVAANWNDWTLRGMLLLEAARYDCRWVFWLDHDETIFPNAEKDVIVKLLSDFDKVPTVTRFAFPWLQCWEDENTVRLDGWWHDLRKPFLQRNPYFQNIICWQGTPTLPLHAYPIPNGTVIHRNDIAVLHYGIMTENLRVDRYARYEAMDPEGKLNDKFMAEKVGRVVQKPTRLVAIKDLNISEFQTS